MVVREKKFTEEVLVRIRELVRGGARPAEVAERVGTTLGSLSVTCSRLGISLRVPRVRREVRRLVCPTCGRE